VSLSYTEQRSIDGLVPVDWKTLLSGQDPDHEWVVEPVLPAGRQVAIFSPAKQGKSLLSLELAAALSAGREIFGHESSGPLHVVYIDMEMTASDLHERVVDLDYNADDLEKLHYYQLCALNPLDRQEGATQLMALVKTHCAQVVILDTMARVVGGDENDADTYRAFYKFTGSQLKQAGITLLRLDHAGKDGARGQRGSSGKNDDVDVVWHLATAGNRVTLTRSHSRIPWIPERVTLTRETEPILRHRQPQGDLAPEVAALVNKLNELRVPVEATIDEAENALRSVGCGKRRQLVGDAQKARKTRAATTS
jgi:AAA domain